MMLHDTLSRIRRLRVLVALLCVASAWLALPGDGKAREPATQPAGILFAAPLADAPGKQLTVVALEFPPKPEHPFMPHHHPGSVYVYVTRGTVRLGIEDQPVREVHAGESFFEPVGAHHTVGENASATEPASAIAVMIVPDGAPLLTADAQKGSTRP